MKLTKRILGAAITVAVITSLTSCGDSVEEGGAVNSLKDSMNSATDTVKENASSAADSAVEMADKAGDAAGDMVESAKETAGEYVDKANDEMDDAKAKLDGVLN